MRAAVLALVVAGFTVSACKQSGGSGPGDGGGEGGLLAGCPQNNPDDLISDFEFDNSLHAADGRQGGWYTYGDDAGTFAFGAEKGFEIAFNQGNPSCSPDGALHVKGTGFAKWGAATGVDWRPRPSDGDGGYADKMTYDAQKYRGVSFWAKSSEPLDGVQVAFPDLYTDGAAAPHEMPHPTDSSMPPLCTDCRCIYNAASEYNCSPYLVQFGRKGDAAADTVFSAYANVQLNPSWQRIEVKFVDTQQDPGNGGYHTPANKLTVGSLTAMAIQVNADYSTGAAQARDFEIWIDDVAFIK